jgi:hypothetical protein
MGYVTLTDGTLPRITERDEANTTNTQRTPPALSDSYVHPVSCGYDANGDIWLIARGDTSQDLKKCQYNRGAGTWGSWSTIYTGSVESYYGGNVSLRTGPLQAGGVMLAIFQETATDVVYTTPVTIDPSGGGFGMPIR